MSEFILLLIYPFLLPSKMEYVGQNTYHEATINKIKERIQIVNTC